MKDRIYINRTDFERLHRLLHGQRVRGVNRDDLNVLEEELDRAEVMDQEEIPPDVVTMDSEVRLQDLDSGDVKVYRLVFPTRTRPENSISILAPLGTALLGYRVGDVIEWPVPRGLKRFQILEVLYQPEAAGAARK